MEFKTHVDLFDAIRAKAQAAGQLSAHIDAAKSEDAQAQFLADRAEVFEDLVGLMEVAEAENLMVHFRDYLIATGRGSLR